MQSRYILTIALAAAVLAGTTMGCAKDATLSNQNQTEQTIWRFRHQYVRLAPQEICPDRASEANAHPVRLTVDELQAALASLRFTVPRKDKTIAVFTEAQLDTLVPPVITAFQQADAGQDVTLGIEGAHPGGVGYQRGMTTARLFFRDGNMHLIFGSLHAAIDDYDSPLHVENTDRRVRPFPVASRCQESPVKGAWVVTSPGIQSYARDGVPRNDWLILKWGQSPATGATPAGTAVHAPSPMKSPDGQGALQRLEILKQLRDKDLITDEEYRNKKLQILDEL